MKIQIGLKVILSSGYEESCSKISFGHIGENKLPAIKLIDKKGEEQNIIGINVIKSITPNYEIL